MYTIYNTYYIHCRTWDRGSDRTFATHTQNAVAECTLRCQWEGTSQGAGNATQFGNATVQRAWHVPLHTGHHCLPGTQTRRYQDWPAILTQFPFSDQTHWSLSTQTRSAAKDTRGAPEGTWSFNVYTPFGRAQYTFRFQSLVSHVERQSECSSSVR